MVSSEWDTHSDFSINMGVFKGDDKLKASINH